MLSGFYQLKERYFFDTESALCRVLQSGCSNRYAVLGKLIDFLESSLNQLSYFSLTHKLSSEEKSFVSKLRPHLNTNADQLVNFINCNYKLIRQATTVKKMLQTYFSCYTDFWSHLNIEIVTDLELKDTVKSKFTKLFDDYCDLVEKMPLHVILHPERHSHSELFIATHHYNELVKNVTNIVLQTQADNQQILRFAQIWLDLFLKYSCEKNNILTASLNDVFDKIVGICCYNNIPLPAQWYGITHKLDFKVNTVNSRFDLPPAFNHVRDYDAAIVRLYLHKEKIKLGWDALPNDDFFAPKVLFYLPLEEMQLYSQINNPRLNVRMEYVCK